MSNSSGRGDMLDPKRGVAARRLWTKKMVKRKETTVLKGGDALTYTC
jgi:hypothetical protein